jgi:HAD superfamily phosphoserine phosphatase-like hydrolase
MKKIAIYDMDRTITRRGTFTPFLIFSAKRQPSRLLMLPVFFAALLGYPLKIFDRKTLKQIGFKLILGKTMKAEALTARAWDYAAHVCARNIYDQAVAQIAADKADGRVLVMATASPDFYAKEIGARLGFDHVLGTVQGRVSNGDYSAQIESDNCYAVEKLRRIEEWLPFPRAECHIRFYSDHHSDEPVFAWADEQIATTPNAKLRAMAHQRNWTIADYS